MHPGPPTLTADKTAAVAPDPEGGHARLLCLDTTTERMALALLDGRQRFTLEEDGGPLASTRLLPAAQELMRQAGWTWPMLDAIAFARGPGAFTGLRVAASVTQGFALGLDKPALAIDSLMIVAEAAWREAEPALGVTGNGSSGSADAVDIWVAMDARMGEIYAAAYRHDSTDWTTVVEPCVLGVEAFNRAFQRTPGSVVAGSALSVFASALELPPSTRRQPGAAGRADALAALASRAWQRGERLDAAQAVPVYVRNHVARTLAERLADAKP